MPTIKSIACILVITISGSTRLVAAEPADNPRSQPVTTDQHPKILHNANEAYQQGDHGRAIRLYTQLLESGLENGHIYYNLGNSLLREGRLGRSIAAYLKSARLMPRDQDVRTNLQFARKSIKDAVEPIKPSTLTKTLFFWHYSLSLRELYLVLGAAGLLFWTGMTIRLYRRESEIFRWVVMTLLIVLLAAGGSVATHTFFPERIVVITDKSAKIHSSTNQKSTVLFELHEGTEAELLQQENNWLKIRLSDGKKGWLQSDRAYILQ